MTAMPCGFVKARQLVSRQRVQRKAVFNPQRQNLQHYQEIFVTWSYIVVIIIITVSSFRMTVLITMCTMNFKRNNNNVNNETFFPLNMLKVLIKIRVHYELCVLFIVLLMQRLFCNLRDFERILNDRMIVSLIRSLF